MGELDETAYLQVRVTGVVQGVGFRPFVWQLAQTYHVQGWVLNDGEGVLIFAKIPSPALQAGFLEALVQQAPPLAKVTGVVAKSVVEAEALAKLQAMQGFEIAQSGQGDMHTGVLPDAATCAACLAEINDPNNRRYGYAFTNCTHCGPRYSIIEQMPYDRRHTSMKDFQMCSACQQEYENPADRRFHAQPNACPECGPQLQWYRPSSAFVTGSGQWVKEGGGENEIFHLVVQALQAGEIVAVKGVGGIHLVCDPCHEQAVQILRERKHRPHKPFALMVQNVAAVEALAEVSTLGKRWLEDVSGAIVLLPKKHISSALHAEVVAQSVAEPIVEAVAPDQSAWGVMLPSNPIHHLLMRYWQAATGRQALLMTSANRSGQPQLFDEQDPTTDTLAALLALADGYLGHDRRIVRRLEDSVIALWPNGQGAQTVRVARGLAPLSLPKPTGFHTVQGRLATGADLKNALALDSHHEVVLSQYLGDMADWQNQQAQQQTWQDLQRLYDFEVKEIVTDAHPNYAVHQWAHRQSEALKVPLKTVAHHHAHLASVLFSHGVPQSTSPVLGIIWDGLGYGEEAGALWGGEFLWADYRHCERINHFVPMPLLGGDLANRQPWRNLYAQLRTLQSSPLFQSELALLPAIQFLKAQPLALLETALQQNLNTPYSSSAGRLFDAMSALCGLCLAQQTYEGEAAMRLTAQVSQQSLQETVLEGYAFMETPEGLSAQQVFEQALNDLAQGESVSRIASRFIWSLVFLIEGQVMQARQQRAFDTVVLSGGVFQNGWLSQLVTERLAGRYTLLHNETIPANDQGIAVGQWALKSLS